jgi:hypothetical protein
VVIAGTVMPCAASSFKRSQHNMMPAEFSALVLGFLDVDAGVKIL